MNKLCPNIFGEEEECVEIHLPFFYTQFSLKRPSLLKWLIHTVFPLAANIRNIEIVFAELISRWILIKRLRSNSINSLRFFSFLKKSSLKILFIFMHIEYVHGMACI